MIHFVYLTRADASGSTVTWRFRDGTWDSALARADLLLRRHPGARIRITCEEAASNTEIVRAEWPARAA